VRHGHLVAQRCTGSIRQYRRCHSPLSEPITSSIKHDPTNQTDQAHTACTQTAQTRQRTKAIFYRLQRLSDCPPLLAEKPETRQFPVGGGLLPYRRTLSRINRLRSLREPGRGHYQAGGSDQDAARYPVDARPDLLAKLDKELGLKAHYQSDKTDYFSRLPQDVSREDFIEYYRNHLMLRFDELSGVLTIELQAFDPEYGQQVVGLMLKESELFINRLGHQVARDQLAFVEKEVDRAYQRLQAEKAKVLTFQNSHQLISPESTSSARLGVVSQIEGELVNQQAQLKQLRSYMKASAPAVISVQSRVDALTKQLEQERAKLTGQDKEAMNEITAGYLDVQTQATLAMDLYKTGLISLEQTRVEAYRKLKHLLVITQPTLAEDAEYPRRLYNLATVGVLLVLFYGLIVMGLATLREHQD